jgi:hypothetical protein
MFPDDDAKNFNFRYGLYITSSSRSCEDLRREYRLRANDENIIKENKEDFGLEGFAQNGEAKPLCSFDATTRDRRS